MDKHRIIDNVLIIFDCILLLFANISLLCVYHYIINDEVIEEDSSIIISKQIGMFETNLDRFDTYYLAIGGTKELDYKYYYPDNYNLSMNYIYDQDIISFENKIITGINEGSTYLTIKANDGFYKTIKIVVTNLITSKDNTTKPYLTCNAFTEEESIMLDEILESRVKEAGYGTRNGVVAAAKFLVYEFPYKLEYFYENGRLVNYGRKRYVDGEGRYYHKGLYLNESKYSELLSSYKGPAIWGCPLYSTTNGMHSNGLDCSGYVTWSMLNGGYNPGDVGAGYHTYRDDDLDDLGEKIKINEENLNNYIPNPGDLLSRNGHIGLLLDYHDGIYYIAESYNKDLHVLEMTREDLIKSSWKNIINLDEYYH